MAQRRMFSISIISSARFLKMPVSSRLLYYDLGMRADDDGVVEAYNVLRMTGSTEDDLRVLVSKGYIKVLNDDLVTYVTDWNEHNKIRADRKVSSIYKDLLLQVIPEIKLIEPKPRADLKKRPSIGRPTDNQRTEMDGIGKISIGKVRLGEFSSGEDSVVEDSIGQIEDTDYIEFFNNNFHPITIYEIQLLSSYISDGIESGAIILALKKAVEANVRNIKYVKKILDNWIEHNIKTLDDVKAADEEFKRGQSCGSKQQSGNFNNFEQRQYDFEKLEDIFTGKREYVEGEELTHE